MAATGEASKTFSEIWDEVERLREERGLKPEAVAKKNGFTRSTWFNYQRTGTIPFHLLERVVEHLGGRLQARVITRSSEASDTQRDQNDDEEFAAVSIEGADELLRIFEQLPDMERGKLIGYAQSLTGRSRPSAPDADARPGRARHK